MLFYFTTLEAWIGLLAPEPHCLSVVLLNTRCLCSLAAWNSLSLIFRSLTIICFRGMCVCVCGFGVSVCLGENFESVCVMCVFPLMYQIFCVFLIDLSNALILFSSYVSVLLRLIKMSLKNLLYPSLRLILSRTTLTSY